MPNELDDRSSRSTSRRRRGRGPEASSDYAIPVFVIEDNRLLREGIVAQVGAHPDVRVVAAAASAEVALNGIRETRPRVVLVDAGLADDNGHHFLARVREAAPDVRIIVMDLLPAQEDVAEFVKAGASGFVMKDATTEEVINAVRSVAAGEDVLPFELAETLLSHIARQALERRPASELLPAVRMTKRERQVVDLIAEGLSNREIGRRLHVGTHTVKSHVHNILEKLALRTRLQIASFDWGQSEGREGHGNLE